MRHDHRASIVAKLTPAELAYARRYPPHTWPVFGPDLAAYHVRDARNAVAPGLAPTPAASALIAALDRYAASRWRTDQHKAVLPDDAEPVRIALHRMLRARDGKMLRARRVIAICNEIDAFDAVMSARNCIRDAG